MAPLETRMLKTCSIIAASLVLASQSFGADKVGNGPPIATNQHCVSYPAAINNHPEIKARVDRMGNCLAKVGACANPLQAYKNFTGVWKGALKKAFIKVPVTITIYDRPNKFLLKMDWKEPFTKTKSQQHSFNVCARPGMPIGQNSLYLVMHNSPFAAGTGYGLDGSRQFKIVCDTLGGLTLDLTPDELGGHNPQNDSVIRGIKKTK
jgi:hypothetical protein